MVFDRTKFRRYEMNLPSSDSYAIFDYESTDTMAVMSGANYFSPVVDVLAIGSRIRLRQINATNQVVAVGDTYINAVNRTARTVTGRRFSW